MCVDRIGPIEAEGATGKYDSVLWPATMLTGQAAWQYPFVRPPRTENRRIRRTWRSVTVAGVGGSALSRIFERHWVI